MSFRVLKAARIYNTETGKFLKYFEKIGLPNIEQETDDAVKSVGKVKIGTGWKQPEIELEEYSEDLIGATSIRIVASYENENGVQETREITARGNIFEHGRSEMKLNEKEGAGKPKITCTYYKEVSGSKSIFEYDSENDVVSVNGVDLMAKHRAAVQ